MIAYARERGIRVVPEFDMPGHSTAWFVGYPDLASGPGPYQIERKWGVMDPAMDPTNEKTYKFLDDFIGEMAKAVPRSLLPHRRRRSKRQAVGRQPEDSGIQESAQHYKDNDDLQAYFSQRVQKLVTKHGKAVVGWDEVFIPGVPKDIVIQSWRGQASLAEAAAQGYRGILSNGYYLDLGWSAARHYAVDPMGGAAANLTPEQQKLILGGEATMWSEYVNAENMDSRIWPRSAAIAERLWSPQSVTDVASMYARMHAESARLELLDLTHRSYYRSMLQRIAGAASPDEFEALKTVADVVEPVKDYKREELAPDGADQHDADESRCRCRTARERQGAANSANWSINFWRPIATMRIRRLVCARNSSSGAITMRSFNRSEQRSFLVKEISQVSQNLSALGTAGLAALDEIAKGAAAPADWKASQTAAITQLQEPRAQLLLVPAGAVQKLVDAASAGGSCAK